MEPITYSPSTGKITATGIAGDLTGDATGNAATATALETARNINGVAFDGTSDITVTAAGSTLHPDTVPVTKGGTGATSLSSNSILTGNGTSAIQAESGLTYTSETLTMSSSTESESAPLFIISGAQTNATSKGELRFVKDVSSVDGEDIGHKRLFMLKMH